MIRFNVHLALFALMSWAPAASWACNTVYLDGSACGYGGPVSVGSFSEVNEFNSFVIAGPPGGKMPLLDVQDGVQSPLGKAVSITHGYVCIGHDMTPLVSEFPGLPEGTLVCNQGMNQKGLAVGLQAQDPKKAGVPAYNPSSSKKDAINWWDMSTFLLARFETVAQVKKALQEQLQITYPTGGAWKGGRGPAQWLGVYDAQGGAIVIQSRNNVIEVLDNPLGVLANYPGFLQDQYKAWKDLTKRHGYTLDDKNFIVGPVNQGAPWDRSIPVKTIKMDAIPGGYNGDQRFFRMAMLSSVARLSKVPGLHSCWPNPSLNPMSPANTQLSNYPKNNPTIKAALAILYTVALPIGMDDSSNAGKWNLAVPEADRFDASYWYTIRDHQNKLFFYRTMNSYVWRMVDLSKSLAFDGLGGKIQRVRLTSPNISGVVDVTGNFMRASNI